MPRRRQSKTTNNRLHRLWIAIGLFALTVCAYWPTLANGFVNLDDSQYVGNPVVAQGLTWSTVRWALTSFDAANWHPLMWMSLQLDQELFGNNPAGHHAISLLIHTANSILLFALLAGMTGAAARSACTAAFFAVHPLHVESVAWVSERKDVLSGFFWLGAVWAYYRYCRQPGKLAYALVILFFSLGLMAKPMLVTVPLVLLLLDYWPLGRFAAPGRESTPSSGDLKGHEFRSTAAWLIAEKSPLVVLSMASCAVTVLAQTRGGAVLTNDQYGLATRLANVPLNYWAYLWRTVWPTNLAAMYPYSSKISLAWSSIAATALLLAVSVLVVRFAKRAPYALVGWFWFCCTLLPVIGILQVGRQATADRYMYMPIIGLLIVLSWGVSDFASRRRWSTSIVAVATGLLLTGSAVVTWLQVGYWHDSIRLWRHALAVVPDSAPTRKLLASALVQKAEINGDLTLLHEAEELFKETIRLEPADEPARIQLARILWQSGRADEAVRQLEVVLETNRDSPTALHDMGYFAERRGKLDEAIAYYREALRLDPGYAVAHQRLGRTLIQRGEVAKGEQHLAEAARLGLPAENSPQSK
jgi:protein O-mannosyl-transferase